MTVWHEAMGGDIWMVGVNGRLDQTQTRELETQLTNLLAERYIYFIVDLTEATYINSGGLRCLVSAWRKANQYGGDLYLCGLSSRLEETIAMVGFDHVFQIYPDPQTAYKEIIPR